MRRKKQLLMAMLCAFSMIINSAAVMAQSKDKQQKSSAQQPPEPVGDVFWIGEPAQEPTFQIALAEPGQRDVIFTPAAQVEFIHNEFNFGGKVVKGAPYSADAVTETIQTLGDGNRIIRKSSSKIYRDSAGRTRREHAMKAVGPWAVSGEPPIMININDPDSGVHYNLNSNAKTARKMIMRRGTAVSGEKVFTSRVSGGSAKGTVKGEGAGDQIKFVTDDNDFVVVSGEAAEKVVAEWKAAKPGVVDLPSSDGQKMVGGLRPTGAISGVTTSGGAVTAFSDEAEANKESLGTQMIEGVMAEGTRLTFTIPAGKIGNERSIVTINERWYSPELQTVVLSKNSDPRMGETTYRLTNIVRSEPDPSLFQVPTDYIVEENSFGFRPGHPGPLKKRRPNDN